MAKRQVAFSTDEQTYEQIVEIARRERRSVSAQIALYVERAVEDRVAAESGSQIDMAEVRRRSEA